MGRRSAYVMGTTFRAMLLLTTTPDMGADFLAKPFICACLLIIDLVE